MNIQEILEDLYTLDPALRAEEAELKDIIEKLLANRPDAEPDEEFKARLKNELLAECERRKKRAGFFMIHRKAVVRAAALAAALIVVLVFAVRPGMLSGVMSPNRMTAAEAGTERAEPQDMLTMSEETQSPAAPAPKRMMEKSDTVELFAADEQLPDFGFAEAPAGAPTISAVVPEGEFSGEEYREIVENDFVRTAEEPVSTFSIDVDTASYSNVRRFLNSGMLPDPDAVRIEELINYFTYDYRQPQGDDPFSITTELSECPWNENHLLLHIGLQGYEVQTAELPPTNLVFLLDSSGSMQDENKLPLLKQSLSLLIDTLRPEDRVSIVAYAGSAGLVLPPTPGSSKDEILAAVERLSAGGSTAGGAGIDLAYRTAAENFLEGGNNRVILATDGDFNVGQSSEEELKAMIEQRRDEGIYLTVLGLGMGNYKDSRMETLADSGNGNYAYIDTLNEAYKVLVTDMSSTLLTIAKDVKIQIDFNNEAVDSYRLIGYENRLMAAEDFSDDLKDAGEIGAGHSVTALYEIVPAEGNNEDKPLAELRFRYKKPEEDQSRLITTDIDSRAMNPEQVSGNFIFSSAVAEWGMLLRHPENAGAEDILRIINRALHSVGQDRYGYRREFIELLKKTDDLLQ